MDYKPGQLVKWVEDWNTYTASDNGVVRGIDPNYRHAIIVSGAIDNSSIVAYCYDCEMLDWIVLSPSMDDFQIISEE